MATAVLHDRELLLRAQAGDADAQAAVMNGSEGFIRWAIRRAVGPCRTWSHRQTEDDALQEARLALWQAVLAWDPARGELTTLGETAIKRALWRWQQHTGPLMHVPAGAFREYREPATVSIDDPVAQVADASALGAPALLAEHRLERETIAARARTAEDIEALLDEARERREPGVAQMAIRIAESVCATPRHHTALLCRLTRRAQCPRPVTRRPRLPLKVIRVTPKAGRGRRVMSGVGQYALDLGGLDRTS